MAVDVVQEIKLRTDLVELISVYVPLRRSGRTHKGLCPFHAEKTPSFHVDGERGFFRCYGCGVGGDCFTFLQQKEGLAFNEAGEMLARRLGLEWVRRGDTAEKRSERERLYDMMALAQRFFRERLKDAPVAQKYLERRGLAPETVEAFGLGYAPPGYQALLGWLKGQKIAPEEAEAADLILRGEHGLRDRFVDRLMFPIFDLEGRPVAFGGRALQADAIPKYLNSRELPIFHKGRTLYGLHVAKQEIPKSGFAVAVEGYMDVIALHQAGIVNAVASLGTAITEQHVGVLRRYSDELVFCYDGDSAGMRAATKNSSLFEAAGCNVRVARLPEGDDPDTFVQKHGADAFRSLLTQAEPLLDYQLNTLRAGYDLTDETKRLGFVREAARIVAQSSSSLTRQAYAAKLERTLEMMVDEWYPGQPDQAQRARLALNQEVRRLLRSDGGAPAGGGHPTNGRVMGRGPTTSGPRVQPPAPVRSGQGAEERYVLRAALSEDRWADRVSEQLTVAHFSDSNLVGVAAKLLSEEGDAAGSAPQRADAVKADPELAGVVSELLMDEAPLNDEGLDRCLEGLERAWKRSRKLELWRAYNAGEFLPEDPRREELRRLSAELEGRQRREA